ncbi:MAG: HAD family hydrolase [Bacteroidota bacterium]
MAQPLWDIDPSWTLFLDRDGVINQRIAGDYVRNWEQFLFCEGSLESIIALRPHFGRIVVVSNQQGVGKGLMTDADVEQLHFRLQTRLEEQGSRLDAIYYCPDLAGPHSTCRKPKTGMAWQAKADFPEINFRRSIMVGDSISDMEFAQQLGMKRVFIEGKAEEAEQSKNDDFDLRLLALADLLPFVV